MIVISFGVVRSGSTLGFEIAKAVLTLNGHPQPRLPDELVYEHSGINYVNHWDDDGMSRLIRHTRGSTVVVKTHEHPYFLSRQRTMEHQDNGDLRIHVVYRDPRDTILSMLDAGAKARANGVREFSEIRQVDDGVTRIRQQLECLRHWGSFPSLKLQYEDIAFSPTQGPRLIGGDLGMSANASDVWEIVNRQFTQKNVARPHRYRNDLASEDAARIERALPEFVHRVIERRDLTWFDANHRNLQLTDR